MDMGMSCLPIVVDFFLGFAAKFNALPVNQCICHSVPSSKVQWRQAVWLLDQRKPDLPSFNSACSACRGLAWQEALQLMRTDLRLRLNVISA